MRRLKRLSITMSLVTVWLAGCLTAQAMASGVTFDIAAGSAPTTLKEFATQAHVQLLFDYRAVVSLKTPAVKGLFEPSNALKVLLHGSGFTFRQINDHTIAVVAITDGATSSLTTSGQGMTSEQQSKEAKKSASGEFSVAHADIGEASSDASVEKPKTREKNESPVEQLQEVIVTAEKRESTVQNTPISMTAVSGLEIRERGLTSLDAIAQSVPGVSMRTSGPGQTEFEMRGMASTGGNSPTVGFYLDDVSLTPPANSQNGKVVIDPSLYDLNRIEVLRGPQGTLYGSGSMGGTIKVVTNAPNPAEFEASLEAIPGYTDGGGFNHGENAMLNIPFGGGTAALRIVGSQSSTSGWIDRIVIANGLFPIETNANGVTDPTGTVRGKVLGAPIAADYRDVNDEDLGAVRASALWTPTDRLTLTGSYFYQRIHQDGSYGDGAPGTNAHYQPFDSPEPSSDDFNLGTLSLRYRFDTFDLTSTTARYTRDVTYYQDGVEEWQWALGLPSYYTSAGGIGPFVPAPFEQDNSKQTSEEVRLTSSSSSRFQWLVGYFYADFTSYANDYYFAPGGVSLFGISNIGSFSIPNTIIQNSFFSELSYQLTPTLTATVGARRYSYNESLTATTSGVAATGTDAVSVVTTSERNQGVNPKFSLSYKPIDDLLLYSTIAKGFRPGGGTGPIPTSGSSLGEACEANLQSVYGTNGFVPGPNAFLPDQVWNYEIGEKFRAFNNRLTVNGAVYFENWSGIQQAIPLACGFNYTANAGDAHVYGSEVELQGILTKGLTLSANVGYTHAAIASSNVVGVGIDPGTRVQEVPDWTAAQSIAYRRNISGELAFLARVDNEYVGPRTESTFALNHLPGYDLTSFRAGVGSDRWSAVLFMNNAFNRNFPLNDVFQISVNLPTYNRVVTPQPRTIGVDFNYRFGR